MKSNTIALNEAEKNYLSKKEFILFLTAIFFYTNMTGMVSNYRQAYLVNVLQLPNTSVSLINTIVGISGYILSFVYASIIDSRKPNKLGKFRSIGMAATIPLGILTVLMFVTPSMPTPFLIAYLCTIAILQGAAGTFGNTINMVAAVMTPNNNERDKVYSFKGILSSIGSSAPLVIVLVVGLLKKPGIITSEGMMYIVSAVLCGIVGTVTMLAGFKVIRERTVYTMKKTNPILGFRDVLKNKYALIAMLSEFLKNFRSIGKYMGIFLAATLLGDTSKYLFFGLPTGIGTFIGMLIVNALLKKFNSKQIYIGSGIYSVIANCGAFFMGFLYFKNPEITLYAILFFLFLFLIGLQFGASNLLPNMFQADILEDIELKTGKRLDASLGVIIGTGTAISGTIGTAIAPFVLYGQNSIIQYIQPIEGVYQTQSEKTKLLLLFFYTIFHGIMMLAAGLPFIFYKLSGKEKERVHAEVLKKRDELKKSNEKENNNIGE